jgi:hypothetical protein
LRYSSLFGEPIGPPGLKLVRLLADIASMRWQRPLKLNAAFDRSWQHQPSAKRG